MSVILTDEHLESLQCTRCRKYLSVFPVKNHASRDVTCGRCSNDDDQDGGVRSALYELIAEKYLFKCVNRYEGCRKLLRVDETAAHERVCLGNVFRCPKCDDETYRSILELIWHYRLDHPSSYLKRDRFEMRRPRDDAMLYVRDDVVFVVLLRFESSTGELRLSAVTLTAVDAAQMFFVMRGGTLVSRIEEKRCQSMSQFDGDWFVVRLDSDDPIEVIFHLEVLRPNEPYSISNNVNPSSDGKAGQILVTEPVVSESVDEPPETVEESSGTPNGEQFMRPLLTEPFRSFSGYRLNDSGTALMSSNGFKVDLTCSNCKQLIGLPIYQCTSSKVEHNICHSCRSWCSLCNRDQVFNLDNTLLGQLCSYLKYPCKWRCGKYFTTDIRTHESACERRFGECPKCSLKIHFEFMELHLQTVHKVFFCEECNSTAIECIIHKKSDGGTVYFLLNDQWCYFKYIRDNSKLNDGRHSMDNRYYLDFFTQDEKLNTKLKIILKGYPTVVVSPTKNCWCPKKRDLYSHDFTYKYTPYLDFNAK